MLLIALAAALAGQAAPAPEGARQGTNVIMSEDPAARRNQEDWGYADAIVAGNMI